MSEEWVINSDHTLTTCLMYLKAKYEEDRHLTVKWRTGKQRTNRQNNALQKYCELLADAFNDAGMDMRAVLREDVDIPWGKDTVREHIWRPIMQAKTQKESTTQLTREEVTQIYETINRHTATKFGISVEFPCEK
jgi:hypothetical protein